MTVVHPNHIVGINSITVQTGDSLSVHKSDGSLIRTIVSNTGVSTFHAVEVSKGGGDLSVGVSTFFVDNSTGRIGIGTIGPYDGSLTVVRNEASGYIASFRSVNSSNSARILVDSPADNNIRPSAIVLANAGTDKWGIGQVYGSSSSGAFHICAGSASESNSKLTITTAGYVGIGSAIPQQQLTVQNDSQHSLVRVISATTAESGIDFGDTEDGDQGKVRYNNAASYMKFDTGGPIERVRINQHGLHSSYNLGIAATDTGTEHIAGAASSFVGLYMGDGFIGFPTALNRDGGYFIATHVNALNAGPVSLGSSMTLHGTWTIV